MRQICLSFMVGLFISADARVWGQIEYELITDVSYRDTNQVDRYALERCRLDLYRPRTEQRYSTVVWFHGGGLTSGNRSVPSELKGQGIGVVAVNYRLSPKVKSPVYVEDAAAAVAWTFQNIEKYGGDAKRIVVSGHSAGGYLTSMIGLDKKYLAAHDVDADAIAALVPFSGHTITHFTVRAESGIDGKQPIVDSMAPLFHVRPNAPPLHLITGDRELEMLGRYEENAYLWRMMKEAGHQQTRLYELDGFDHGGMAQPAMGILLKVMRSLEADQ